MICWRLYPNMMTKLAWVALLGLWVATFMWVGDLEMRQRRADTLANARWYAQLDAFTLYAKTLNQQSDIIVRMAKGDWRTS